MGRVVVRVRGRRATELRKASASAVALGSAFGAGADGLYPVIAHGYRAEPVRRVGRMVVYTITGPRMAMPFHMLLKGQTALRELRQAIRDLRSGKTPSEGVYKVVR